MGCIIDVLHLNMTRRIYQPKKLVVRFVNNIPILVLVEIHVRIGSGDSEVVPLCCTIIANLGATSNDLKQAIHQRDYADIVVATLEGDGPL